MGPTIRAALRDVWRMIRAVAPYQAAFYAGYIAATIDRPKSVGIVLIACSLTFAGTWLIYAGTMLTAYTWRKINDE